VIADSGEFGGQGVPVGEEQNSGSGKTDPAGKSPQGDAVCWEKRERRG